MRALSPEPGFRSAELGVGLRPGGGGRLGEPQDLLGLGRLTPIEDAHAQRIAVDGYVRQVERDTLSEALCRRRVRELEVVPDHIAQAAGNGVCPAAVSPGSSFTSRSAIPTKHPP